MRTKKRVFEELAQIHNEGNQNRIREDDILEALLDIRYWLAHIADALEKLAKIKI